MSRPLGNNSARLRKEITLCVAAADADRLVARRADSSDAVTCTPWASRTITVLPGDDRVVAYVPRPIGLSRVVAQDRHDMGQCVSGVHSQDGKERPIACTGNFPVNAPKDTGDQQHRAYPFNGPAIEARRRWRVFRPVIERSTTEISESLHDGCRIDWEHTECLQSHD